MNQSRRGVLAAWGAGLTTLAGCSAVESLGGAKYEQSDLELTLSMQCASDGSDDVIVTLSWKWDSGNGGAAPGDALVINWPDERWELLKADHRTTETVRFDGKGVTSEMDGVRFRHDDTAAEGGTTYAASCKLSPKGDFAADERQVFGQFAHVREESTGTLGDGWFGDVNEEWIAERETDQSVSPCAGGGS